MSNERSEITYFNDQGNIVEKKYATRAVIRVLDDNGRLVEEIFGSIDPDDED